MQDSEGKAQTVRKARVCLSASPPRRVLAPHSPLPSPPASPQARAWVRFLETLTEQHRGHEGNPGPAPQGRGKRAIPSIAVTEFS